MVCEHGPHGTHLASTFFVQSGIIPDAGCHAPTCQLAAIDGEVLAEVDFISAWRYTYVGEKRWAPCAPT